MTSGVCNDKDIKYYPNRVKNKKQSLTDKKIDVSILVTLPGTLPEGGEQDNYDKGFGKALKYIGFYRISRIE